MKIGLDLDGVLAEFTASYLQYYNDKHGTHHVPSELEHSHFSERLDMTTDEVKSSIVHFFDSPFAKGIMPVKDAQAVLKKLAKKHELHIITSRPLSVSKITLDWLNDFFPDMFTSIHFTSDWLMQPEVNKMKADICIELGVDILIEDYLRYAEACAACVKKYVLLFDRPWNHVPTTKPNVVRVVNWQAVLAFIDDLSL